MRTLLIFHDVTCLYIEGMKPMNNRLLTRLYYEAYKHLSITYTNTQRCGIEVVYFGSGVYPTATVAARKSENSATCEYSTSPSTHFVPVFPLGCVTLEVSGRFWTAGGLYVVSAYVP